jgi:hypothetical protein
VQSLSVFTENILRFLSTESIMSYTVTGRGADSPAKHFRARETGRSGTVISGRGRSRGPLAASLSLRLAVPVEQSQALSRSNVQ